MSNNIGEVFQIAPEFTNVRQYFEPLRLDIEWWDLNHNEQVHSFSSWNPRGIGVANHIPVIDAAVTPPGTSQYGAFNFRVWDTDKVIDPQTVRRKGLIIMKAKKYQADPYMPLIYGFITKVNIQLQRNQLYYQFSGAGSGILLNERYVNLQRTARMKAIDSDIPDFGDELMEVRRLFKELLTNKDLYVVDDVSISEQFNPPMITSGLDESIVNDTLLSISQPYVSASTALNSMLDSTGTDGGIGPDNLPYLTYPLSRTPSITLKSWDTVADQGLDRSGLTSYFMESWGYEIDWSQEAGFSNRILAKSKVTQGTSTASTTGTYGGFETLQDMDLAQKIPASPARFRDLAVIVTRVGEGTINPNQKVLHGHIHQDSGGNSPTGPIVARFDIPLASIPEDNPTAMFLTGLTFAREVDPAKDHWIILYERGNVGGTDTINWYFNTDESLTGTIARRPFVPGTPRAANHEVNSGWEITTGNPFNFAFSVLDSFTHIIIGEDVDSQERYGIVEDLVDISWTSNTIAANKALGELLAIRCLPKVTYQTNAVTIPGKLFMPGMIVRVEDALSNLSSVEGAMAEVSNVSYLFGGSGSSALGADTCDISLVGHYDFKLEEEALGTGAE